ncbi:MAG: DUF2141 domain-containing protein [Novosphingobium sp.]|nr:DUF2141 domain-containing protein [Novosphingobium sp.]
MIRILTIGLVAAAGVLATPIAQSATAGTLTIRMSNVRNAKGEVLVAVCPQAQFLKDTCPYNGSAPAHVGTTVVMIHGLPPGQYAVQTFHDENGNKKVDRNFIGLPREGVGFSNDAPIRMGPPKWADAMFAFNGVEQTIQLKTRYFLGQSGPDKR